MLDAFDQVKADIERRRGPATAGSALGRHPSFSRLGIIDSGSMDEYRVPDPVSPRTSSPNDLDPRLINSVISTESGGNPNARGKAGEVGLMQIMPDTARRLGYDPAKLSDPTVNVEAGGTLLRRLFNKYHGNLYNTLAAYNAGEGAVDKGRIPDSTKTYIRKVMEKMGGGISTLIGEGTAYGAEGPGGFEAVKRDIERRKAGPAATSAPEKPLPWPVRAADWAPGVGQVAGEIGAGFLAPETGGASILGIGAGGAAGELTGETVRRSVRDFYGLPNITPGQEAKNVGIAGLTSAAGVPIGWGANKVLSSIAPAALKAALRAKGAYGEASEAAGSAMRRLSGVLGMGEDEARTIAQQSGAGELVRDPFFAAKNQALHRLGNEYSDILNGYAGKTIKQAETFRVLNQEALKGDQAFGRVYGNLPQVHMGSRPWTPRTAQDLRSAVRDAIRQLNPDRNADAIASLRKVEEAATKDIESTLSPRDAARFQAVDRAWADTRQRVFSRTYQGQVVRAPGAPKAAGALIGGEESQIARILNELDSLPAAQREPQMSKLRKGVASYVHDAASRAPNRADQIGSIQKALEGVPDNLFERLYGTDRKTMIEVLNRSIEGRKQILSNPDMRAALQREMADFKVRFGDRHPHVFRRLVEYEPMFALASGVVSLASGRPGGMETGAALAAAGPAMYAALAVPSRIVNSAPLRRLYINMVMSKTPAALATTTRAFLSAYAGQAVSAQPGGESSGTSP